MAGLLVTAAAPAAFAAFTAVRLGPDQRARYAGLTYPRYQRYLAMPEAQGAFAYGIDILGAPAALALGVIVGRYAEVLSVVVTDLWRGQGLGRTVAEALLAEFARRGALGAVAAWVDDGGNPAWTALAGRLGFAEWRQPQHVCVLDIVRSLSVPWISRNRLGADFRMIAYADLPEGAYDTLPAPGSPEDWIPKDLRPPRTLPERQRELSLALLRGDRLVAWVLAERQSSDTTLSPVSYADPALRALAPIIPLYREYVRRSGEIGARYVRFTVPPVHGGMAQLFLRRISSDPACVHQGALRSHYRPLTDPPVIPDSGDRPRPVPAPAA
jgi:GNAT superfamily N-acetyltransferase